MGRHQIPLLSSAKKDLRIEWLPCRPLKLNIALAMKATVQFELLGNEEAKGKQALSSGICWPKVAHLDEEGSLRLFPAIFRDTSTSNTFFLRGANRKARFSRIVQDYFLSQTPSALSGKGLLAALSPPTMQCPPKTLPQWSPHYFSLQELWCS